MLAIMVQKKPLFHLWRRNAVQFFVGIVPVARIGFPLAGLALGFFPRLFLFISGYAGFFITIFFSFLFRNNFFAGCQIGFPNPQKPVCVK